MAVGVFAGIPVRDHGSALQWQHGSVRKDVFHDPDGNEAGIGGEVPTGD